MDGASGYPLLARDQKTTLELARTPALDAIVKKGVLGLSANVPDGMEPSSAVACMSVMGYDPKKYYSGRGPIEARAMGISLKEGETAFRCNLVTVKDGAMRSYSCGHITDRESHQIITTLQKELGSVDVTFYPGVSYRHICVIRNKPGLLSAVCTPPHDIPNQPIIKHIPRGEGARTLNDLMIRSEEVLRNHPVNKQRIAEGKEPATTIWLFWGGQQSAGIPPFATVYGKKAAMTSGVDLLRGIADMAGIENLKIPGVTGGLDTDYAAQAEQAVRALEKFDLIFVHVEAPDEAGHGGQIEEKIKAIEQIDEKMLPVFLGYAKDELRLLCLPDHPTPILTQTHAPEPVPFVLHGPGIGGNDASRFTEKEADATGYFVSEGHTLLGKMLYT